MRDETDAVISAFADAILDQDWDAAHHYCAAWVQEDVDAAALGALIDAVREERPWPATYRVSGNSFTTPDTLRDKWAHRQASSGRAAAVVTGAPVRPIPDEVTMDIHRRFALLHFEPSDEDIAEHDVEVSFVIRTLLVAQGRDVRIGWFEATT